MGENVYSGGTDARESDELGLRHYLDVVVRRRWTALAVFVASLFAALLFTLLQATTYAATTKIVVGQGAGLIPAPYAGAVQPYTATMADLVTSNIVATRVISQLHLDSTPQDLLSKLSVSINPTTAVMTVTVEDQSRARAVRIARRVGSVFSTLVRERFGGKPVAIAPGTVELPLTARVFDPAHALPGAVSPKPAQDAAIGIAIGIVLGLVAAFLREHFDRRLATREAVEAAFGVPVIAQIPGFEGGDDEALAEHGPVPEAVRALRTNLEYLAVRRPLRTLLVTSPGPQQGKTTVTAQLGAALARSGGSAALVDADLRRPRLERLFGEPAFGIGLSGLIVGGVDLDGALLELAVETGHGGGDGRLALLPSGPLPPNPSELLAADEMQHVLERLGVTFDHVLVDSPPLLPVADSLELARLVDGVVLVVRLNRTTRDEAREVRELARRLGFDLVGVVLTDVPTSASAYGSYERGPENELPLAPSSFETFEQA